MLFPERRPGFRRTGTRAPAASHPDAVADRLAVQRHRRRASADAAGNRAIAAGAKPSRCRTSGGPCRAGADDAADQRLRPDGDARRSPAVIRFRNTVSGCGFGSDRPPDREYPGYVLDARSAAGADRGAGRTVPRRRRAGPRVSEPPGVDGGAVRDQPVRRPGRGCIARATWSAGGPTGSWSSWAAWTTR